MMENRRDAERFWYFRTRCARHAMIEVKNSFTANIFPLKNYVYTKCFLTSVRKMNFGNYMKFVFKVFQTFRIQGKYFQH